MHISYVTTYNALDVSNWSGLSYFIADSLKAQGNQVDYIGDLTREAGPWLWAKKAAYKAMGKTFDLNREPAVIKGYSRQIANRLNKETDLIFSPGSIPIALLESKQRKVFYTDSTFAGMIGFYKEFSNYCPETIRHGNYLEKMAIDSSAMVIYSSEWAAKTAIDHYGADAGKIKVVPFGANLHASNTYEDLKAIVQSRAVHECNLLFLAVDWARKGGDQAVKIAAALNDSGLPCKLHVAGIKSLPFKNPPDFIVDHGFISKKEESGRKKLAQLFATCHFLVLPTIADCSPVVLPEANAFGMPCLTTDVGGIPTIVRENLNGKTFGLAEEPRVYAEYIQSFFDQKRAYEQLCYSAFHEFDTRLNWRISGKKITDLLAAV